jgi:hypothetical protein
VCCSDATVSCFVTKVWDEIFAYLHVVGTTAVQKAASVPEIMDSSIEDVEHFFEARNEVLRII